MTLTTSENSISLSGIVLSGRGKAKSELGHYFEKIKENTGKSFTPGSLNVVASCPIRLKESTAFYTDGHRMLWDAKLNDTPVHIYRWKHAPLHIFEILSSDHLRSKFGLEDKDKVNITLNDSDVVELKLFEKCIWYFYWIRRECFYYESDAYYYSVREVCKNYGAVQIPEGKSAQNFFIDCLTRRSVIKSIIMSFKTFIKSLPVFGPLAIKCNRSLESLLNPSKPAPKRVYQFERTPLDVRAPENEQALTRIRNLLNYTKLSATSYSADLYDAGYHSININGVSIKGQREPGSRLESVPFDFTNKTVLDIGSNQGGMLHILSDKIRFGIGIDYDTRMVNVANRIKEYNDTKNLQFYVFNLEKESLGVIEDLLPEAKVDIVFLLSVCMWLPNWKDVITFAFNHSDNMLFETNGTDEQQNEQSSFLQSLYPDMQLLAETSEDDPRQKKRKLIFCPGSK